VRTRSPPSVVMQRRVRGHKDISSADNPNDGIVTGTFNPEGTALVEAFDGMDVAGEWRLTIIDDNAVGNDIGKLVNWSLVFRV